MEFIQIKPKYLFLLMVIRASFAFGTSAGYNVLSNAADAYTNIFSFAKTKFFGSLLTFWIMPETKGKSLEKIQATQNPGMKGKLESERIVKKS